MAATSILSTQGFPQSEEVEMSSRPASPLRPVISSMQRMLLIAAVLVCLAAGPGLPDGGAAALAHDRREPPGGRSDAAAAARHAGADAGRARSGRGGVAEALLSALLTEYERGGARLRRLQILARRRFAAR